MNELKQAWENYLQSSDKKALLKAIKEFSIPVPSEYDYPFVHRICDIQIGRNSFRVTRLADSDETIYINKCDTPSLEVKGVPYWLKGNKLQEWVKLESDKPSKEETNWNNYR